MIGIKRIVCLIRRPYDSRTLTSSEVATALRPFYFAVHPDLFGQYPKEREINESSLKYLKDYIHMVEEKRPSQSPIQVPFYLKPQKNSEKQGQLTQVHVSLTGGDVRNTVLHILKVCKLPTTYVESLSPKSKKYEPPDKPISWRPSFAGARDEPMSWELRKMPIDTLRAWLDKNVSLAEEKIIAIQPIKEEIERLHRELEERLEVERLIWDSDWGLSSHRSCLRSLFNLADHHPQAAALLKGRTVVLGRLTGVSLDGHVILSSDDVRTHWLELIKKIHLYDAVLARIPAIEKTVSQVLFGIKVVHRKFKPAMQAQSYEAQLRKLSASLTDNWVKSGYPPNWPKSLAEFQIGVEGDSGPLMLSPTGQFIVPASCPGFLVVNFISSNLDLARQKLEHYRKHKDMEKRLTKECIETFSLSSLLKDDNVTPDLMNSCLQRLLAGRWRYAGLLYGTQLKITNFYSVLQDGQVCIPWNWTDSN